MRVPGFLGSRRPDLPHGLPAAGKIGWDDDGFLNFLDDRPITRNDKCGGGLTRLNNEGLTCRTLNDK